MKEIVPYSLSTTATSYEGEKGSKAEQAGARLRDANDGEDDVISISTEVVDGEVTAICTDGGTLGEGAGDGSCSLVVNNGECVSDLWIESKGDLEAPSEVDGSGDIDLIMLCCSDESVEFYQEVTCGLLEPVTIDEGVSW